MSATQQSPFAQQAQAYMRAVMASESAAFKGDWREAFRQVGHALRAQSAIIGVFTQTLDLTTKEVKEQAEIILDLQARIVDLEGRMGNVAKGLEKLDDLVIPGELGDSFPGLADRYNNTKEKE